MWIPKYLYDPTGSMCVKSDADIVCTWTCMGWRGTFRSGLPSKNPRIFCRKMRIFSKSLETSLKEMKKEKKETTAIFWLKNIYSVDFSESNHWRWFLCRWKISLGRVVQYCDSLNSNIDFCSAISVSVCFEFDTCFFQDIDFSLFFAVVVVFITWKQERASCWCIFDFSRCVFLARFSLYSSIISVVESECRRGKQMTPT